MQVRNWQMSRVKYSAHLLREWYVDQSVGKLAMYSIISGGITGYIMGKRNWRNKIREDVADTLEIVSYKLDSHEKDDVKVFESSWNSHARHAQTTGGYQWTKLLKTRDWKSPSDFVELRLWKDKDCLNKWHAKDTNLSESFTNTKIEKEVYVCVLDDTVRRLIDV